MPLSSDFKNQAGSPGAQKNEVKLFGDLIKCLNRRGAIAKQAHQHYVKFEDPKVGRNIRREIADILIIFVGKEYIRYTLLQNKKSKTSINPNTNAIYVKSIDYYQWYLLAKKPIISSNKYPSNILSNAILGSAGTYGDFYNDGTSYDMRFFVADCAKQKGTSNKSACFDVNVANNSCRNKSGFCEVLRLERLDDFETFGKHMMIGTPIPVNGQRGTVDPEILRLLRNVFKDVGKTEHLSENCLQKMREFIKNTEIDNGNNAMNDEVITNLPSYAVMDATNLGEFDPNRQPPHHCENCDAEVIL